MRPAVSRSRHWTGMTAGRGPQSPPGPVAPSEGARRTVASFGVLCKLNIGMSPLSPAKRVFSDTQRNGPGIAPGQPPKLRHRRPQGGSGRREGAR
jgi:hypothetical protein